MTPIHAEMVLAASLVLCVIPAFLVLAIRGDTARRLLPRLLLLSFSGFAVIGASAALSATYPIWWIWLAPGALLILIPTFAAIRWGKPATEGVKSSAPRNRRLPPPMPVSRELKKALEILQRSPPAPVEPKLTPLAPSVKSSGNEAGAITAKPASTASSGEARKKSARRQIFISYSKEDKKTADLVCSQLEHAGFPCWIAPRNISPGLEWAEGIIEGLDHSALMVLIFSSHSNRSIHVKKEVERAYCKNLTVIPVRIENVPPTGSMEYFMSSPHWLDATAPPMAERMEELLAVVWSRVGEPASSSR